MIINELSNMRKEYLPAILIYVASAVLCIVAAVMFFMNNYRWATVGLFGIILLLFASSRLVKIGKFLREQDENEKNK